MRSKLIRSLVMILAIIFCIVYLSRNANDLKSVWITLEIAWQYFFLSFAIISLVVCTGGFAWILILRGVGQKIKVLDGLRIQNFSNISKYIPGFIWPYASKIYLSNEIGIDQSVAGLSVFMEFSLLIITGLFTSLFFLPEEFLIKINFTTENIYLFRTLISGGLILFLGSLYILLKLIQKRLPRSFSIKSIFLLAASLLLSLNWVGLGVALWLLSKSLYIRTPVRFDHFVFSFVVSVISGILFLPVPNGIGVRESVMVFFLREQIPSSVAVFIAIISRLLITVGEVVNFFVMLLIQRIRNRRKK